MVHSPKPAILADGEHLTEVNFTHGETIRFGSLEFIADRFDNLSLSDKGKDSDTVFVGMAHNGSPSLHTVLDDSANEGDIASSGGGELQLSHLSRVQHGDPECPHHNHTTTGGTLGPLTIVTILLQIIIL
jgi:hypothetical protein